MKDRTTGISLLSLIAMLLLVLSSLTAILLDDGGDPYSFTTPRGEPIEMYGGNGPYQFDNTYKAIAFRSFDWANLFVVFPIFLAGLILFRRNKFRGQLLLAALFTYLAYIYLIGVMGNAFNAMFLVWTAIFSTGVFGLYLTLKQMDFTDLSTKLVANFPRKSVAIYMVVVGLILLGQYLSEVITAYTTGSPPASLDHYTTLELAALELGIMIPLKIIGGIALWRKEIWGYLATAVLVFTTSIVFVALSISLLLFHFSYGPGDLLDMAITFGITIVASGFSIAIFKRVSDQ
jgi:hypothetical protein